MADKRDIIRPGTKGDIVLLGFPHDEGVEINGGRVGARSGPQRFRYHIHRFGTVCNPQMNIDLTHIALADAGDIPTDGALEEAHANLTRHAETILADGGIPFVVGGGNDQSYPNAAALLNQNPEQPVGVINIDAHLDVRPLKQGRAHSGSPFRLLLEDDRFDGRNFVEFASQGSQCNQEHADYVRAKNGRILWLDEARRGDCMSAFREYLGKLAWRCPSIFVSFDLDAICGADAPGVSCPGIVGLSAREALTIAYIAGSHPQVDLFDLSEYNPEVEEYRTGRLAAGIFYYFCLGAASRAART
ncbi:MAG: formimidoylglutamase [Nitrospinales bacterium]